MSFFLRHPEIPLFGIITAVYVVCCAPDFTWFNANCDGFGLYLASMDPLATSDKGFFLYTLMGNVAMRLPLGSEVWRLAFFCSAVPAIATSVLLFYAVRKQTFNAYAPYVASASFAGCVVVLSQATIIEVYSMVTFFAVLAYTLSVYGRSKWAALVLGLMFFVNFTTAIVCTLSLLVYRRDILAKGFHIVAVVVAAFVLIQMFILESTNYWNTVQALVGTLPITHVPARLLEGAALVCVGTGLALIPAFYYFRDWRNAWPIIVLLVILFTYYMEGYSGESLVQLLPAFAFISVAAGLGMEKLRTKHLEKAVLVVSLILLLVMPAFWDIGRVLDETPTTARQYLTQVEQLPIGAVVTGERALGNPIRSDWHGALNHAGVWVVGRDDVIIMDSSLYNLGDSKERERLSKLGFNTPMPTYVGQSYFAWMATLTQAFVDANPGALIYWVNVTEAEVFGCELELWR